MNIRETAVLSKEQMKKLGEGVFRVKEYPAARQRVPDVDLKIKITLVQSMR